MGQVATAEVGGHQDIFGKHVNRASRVESMAAGGQTYVSATVYDSAKGWIENFENEPVRWTHHGTFKAKGIAEGMDIYEVSDTAHGEHRPPVGKSKSAEAQPPIVPTVFIRKLIFPVLLLGLLVILGGAGYMAKSLFRPSVKFQGGPMEDIVLDGKSRMLLENLTVQTPISTGHHFIYHYVSNVVRNSMEFDVQAGSNLIEQKWGWSQMPDLDLQYRFGDPNPVYKWTRADFFDYDSTGHKKSYQCNITISAMAPKSGNANSERSISWKLEINGKTVSEGAQSVTSQDTEKAEKKELFKEGDFRFYLKHSEDKQYGSFAIEGEFINSTRN